MSMFFFFAGVAMVGSGARGSGTLQGISNPVTRLCFYRLSVLL